MCGQPTAVSVYRCATHPRKSEFGSGAVEWAFARSEGAFLSEGTVVKVDAEAERIVAAVLRALHSLGGKAKTGQLAVVVNISRDRTRNALDRLARRHLVTRSRRGVFRVVEVK